LKRLTGHDGYVKNLKKEDLNNFKLLGTEFYIPTLEEVLTLIGGKVPVLIEIKNEGKVGVLENNLLNILKNYKGEFAIQSFNPFVLQWFKNNAPEIIRGQLSSRFKNENLNFIKKFLLKRMYFNKKISEPHFIAYEAKALPNRFAKKCNNIPLLAWTVRGQEEYKKVAPYCDNIIYEKFEPEMLKD
jgi:glycerophosphoryl diester phosphodiesterase